MFEYVLSKYVNRHLDTADVYSLVPLFLTQKEAEVIVATPQIDVSE